MISAPQKFREFQERNANFGNEAQVRKSASPVRWWTASPASMPGQCQAASCRFETVFRHALNLKPTMSVVVIFGSDRESWKARRQAAPLDRRRSVGKEMLGRVVDASAIRSTAGPIAATKRSRVDVRRPASFAQSVHEPMATGLQAIDALIRSAAAASDHRDRQTGKTAVALAPSSPKSINRARTKAPALLRLCRGRPEALTVASS